MSTLAITLAPATTPNPGLSRTLTPYAEMIHLFDYDSSQPLDMKEATVKQQDGIAIHDISYASVITGERVSAYLVVPPGKGSFAGIVFMHWLGSPHGNRDEFLDEAVALAKQGVISLLVQGRFPWSVTPKNLAADRQAIVDQVIDLRRAFDLLLSQPSVDAGRIGYVGHDFGAMYGGILADVDKRAKAYVLMAGTATFSAWFLTYWAPAQGSQNRLTYTQAMQVFDPISHVAYAAPAVLFFQFANSDRFIPKDVAQQFYDAGTEPKSITWYDASHGLNEQARADRVKWLSEQLSLKATP
jgi:dienelactone hydrolase